MDTLLQDLRYAVRTLAKSPAFTMLAVLCLALGIGVNTTIFSVVDGALLRPFPFENPDRLVALKDTRLKDGIEQSDMSYRNFRDWQTQTTTFAAVAAFSFRSLTLSDGEEPERLQGETVTWDLFPLLGVRPQIGRVFREDEDRPGAERVVMLSDEVWRRRYARDRGVIGRSIMVNGNPHTVIGVMPPRFKFPENAELWVTLTPYFHDEPRDERDLAVLARLAPRVSEQDAATEVAAIAKRLESQYPADNQGWSTRVMSIREALVGEETNLIVLTMMGAVSFVLLIACANVANLMLARATARHREIAVRASLGAGRARIVRQLLTESLMIALVSGAIGALLAVWGVDLVNAAIPPQDALPYYISFDMDARVLLYTLGVSVLTGVVFGLAPALQAAKTNLLEALKEGGRGSGAGARRSRLRSTLVVAEVALSLVLLVGASLFVRSFLNVQRASAGFDTRPIMSLRFYLPGDRYDAARPKAQRVDDIVRRVEALPGVEAAAAANGLPLGSCCAGGSIVIDGRPTAPGEEPRIGWNGVTPHWFRTLGVPLASGRDMTDAEGRDSSGVALINATMAKKLWSGADPLGRRFRFANDTTARAWLTVIGVVPDIRDGDIEARKPQATAYLPYPYLAARNTALMVRIACASPVSGCSPARITTAVRAQIRASDPALPVFEIQTMDEVRELGFWQFGLFSWMFSIFGVLALLLAAVGVYGVLSYAVSQRRHEIGVRVALGAGRRDVLRLVVSQGVVLALLGVGVGLLGAFGVTRVITSVLYDVSPSDPLSYVAVALFLTAIAFLASYIPARRAARVDPMVALRTE